MGKARPQRRLTAILCADVAGYSRLMGADDEATIETLTAYRKVFLSHIENHQGRVVDAKGDAILAEFTSVVDAVNGAVEIQRELAEKNADLSEDRRMDFRVGINLGDVVVKDDVIYGDGVNIAARVESLAEGGGICISGSVYQQVKNRLPVGFHDLGEQSVKNFADPVRVFRVVMDGEELPPRPQSGFLQEKRPETSDADAFLRAILNGEPIPLPKQPSVAVLAFENLSSDPEQSFFGDGISEDIITDLSKIPGMVLMSRTSSFAYKGKKVDVRQIGRELGVRYVLEGSVRKLGRQVRVTAQLIEAETGHHVWVERYDRIAEDLFLVGDEITNAVVTELDVKLGWGSAARVYRNVLKKPKSRENLALGMNNLSYMSKEATQKAREYFESVIAEEPDHGWGYSYVAYTHTRDLLNGWSEDPGASCKSAEAFAAKGLELDPFNAGALAAKAELSLYLGDFENALQFGEACVKARPT
jgi:adenylate cyclase